VTKQDYETPPELVEAVERRFGRLTADLACTPRNAKISDPDGEVFSLENGTDSLANPWPTLGRLWLNPPYADIAPWAAKASAWRGEFGARLLMLTPASVGAAWFRDHVHGRALVLALSPRIRFVGSNGTDLRDYILSVFGDGPGFDCWRWMTPKKKGQVQ